MARNGSQRAVVRHRFGPCCADAVRSALAPYGYDVHELPDWLLLGEGPLDVDALVWHHDASAKGFSPGMADYIQRQVRQHKAGANIWVGLDGGWRFLAAGVTYHAGKVLPGKPDNTRSAGIETDHTTGEDIGLDLLLSLRVGTAALLAHWGEEPADAFEFHATVCSPPGRKTDPDGLVLDVERAAVHALMEDEMLSPEAKAYFDRLEMRVTDVQNRTTKIENAVAGYATVDGKRADGAPGNPPKKLSYFGWIGQAARTLLNKPGSELDSSLKR